MIQQNSDLCLRIVKRVSDKFSIKIKETIPSHKCIYLATIMREKCINIALQEFSIGMEPRYNMALGLLLLNLPFPCRSTFAISCIIFPFHRDWFRLSYLLHRSMHHFARLADSRRCNIRKNLHI